MSTRKFIAESVRRALDPKDIFQAAFKSFDTVFSGLVGGAVVLLATSANSRLMTLLLPLILLFTAVFKYIVIKVERSTVGAGADGRDGETDTSSGRRLTPPAERPRRTPLVRGPTLRGVRRGGRNRRVTPRSAGETTKDDRD